MKEMKGVHQTHDTNVTLFFENFDLLELPPELCSKMASSQSQYTKRLECSV